eukprot:13047743-Heterocapsa_arctica.AAC.1
MYTKLKKWIPNSRNGYQTHVYITLAKAPASGWAERSPGKLTMVVKSYDNLFNFCLLYTSDAADE